MPIYEYECDIEQGGCGYKFEEIQGIQEEAKKKCPKCNELKLKKLFGKPGLVFKGTGFYKTDYKDLEAK
jgi:putative FmdB family regulatory protein